ncbi:MAG: hypothetical protein BWY96_02264 [Spirochaetes bacterium ADurb.BinA120]|nr:MAG: hypothetical protein BWY96_02264 [Spirochaetes bacterium ADurb.BinA120]
MIGNRFKVLLILNMMVRHFMRLRENLNQKMTMNKSKLHITVRRHFAALRAARAPLHSATFCFVTSFAVRKTRTNQLRGTQNVAYAWTLCIMKGKLPTSKIMFLLKNENY